MPLALYLLEFTSDDKKTIADARQAEPPLTDDGPHYLGGLIVEAASLVDAEALAQRRGLDPGGEMDGRELPRSVFVPETRTMILLSRDEVREIKGRAF